MAEPEESFEEGVRRAIGTILETDSELKRLDAEIEGRTVTLIGIASSDEVRLRVVREFNELIEVESTINKIRVERYGSITTPASRGTRAAGTKERSKGSPASIAREYYGKAARYPKIFNPDRDILDDPALVKAGHRLRIKP